MSPFSIDIIDVVEAPKSASHFHALWDPFTTGVAPLAGENSVIAERPQGASIPLHLSTHATPQVTVVPHLMADGVFLLISL